MKVMVSLRAAALIVVGCSACTAQGEFSRPGASAAQFEADHQRCAGIMYAARRSHSAPDWSVYDYCMERRGYRRSNRPA
ncbi:MAG TPA: hypothetical protein VF943_07610 [Burkholderiales bacterium]